jgi:N-acetyltransferase
MTSYYFTSFELYDDAIPLYIAYHCYLIHHHYLTQTHTAHFTHYILHTTLFLLLGIPTVPNGAHRMITTDKRSYTPQVMIHGEWVHMYRFLLDESYPSDWEMGSHYCSTHKDSKFVNNIIVTKFEDNSLKVLVNKEYSIKRHLADDSGEEILETREIQSEKELKNVLRDEFGIELEEEDRLCPPGSSWEKAEERE